MVPEDSAPSSIEILPLGRSPDSREKKSDTVDGSAALVFGRG